jgi:hypothetical protein
MSVDQRLHELFADSAPEVSVGSALDQVHRRAREEQGRRRAGAGGLLVALLVGSAAVGLTVGDDDGSPSPAPPAPSDTITPLDGVWETGPVSAGKIRATLRAAGLDAWTPTVLADLPQPPVRYRMTVADGVVTVRLAGSDQRFERFDEGSLVVTGDTLQLTPTGQRAVNRYRWEIVDSALRLTLESSSEGPSEGTPNEAFQRALYETSDWTLVDCRLPPFSGTC